MASGRFENLFRKKSKKKQDTSMESALQTAGHSGDFIRFYNDKTPSHFWVSYFKSIIDPKILHQDILIHLKKLPFHSLDEFKSVIPIENILIIDDIDEIQNKLHDGYVMIQLSKYDKKCALIDAGKKAHRQVDTSEIEFTVMGPKQAFVESLDTNLNLIRQRLPVPKLVFKEILVGKLSKTKVIVAYIDGIANEENVNTMIQRLSDIEFDEIVDVSILQQIINDNSKSVFPQYLNTEKPDRVASLLGEGKVAVLSEGSSQVITAPTSYFEMFVSQEDYYLPWIVGSSFRVLRFFSILFSVVATPAYVAVLTFHYEMIPKEMLQTLISSRANIPFPPIAEVLFMELTIELLREAGARLPTKVGQTLGIVGGIVIGQAAVAAGLTSNVLLIVVALAALASFTTPDYKMANTIRLIRFPFIFCAALWGGLGIVLCFCFFIIHLLRLTSLGRPYFSPFYPPRGWDFRDSVVRLAFNKLYKRPIHLQTEDPLRFNPKRANRKKDIDE